MASALFPAGQCVLSPPLHPSCSVSWVHSGSTISGVLCVSSGVLISGCKTPDGCQPSRIPGRLVSNWEPACCLVGDAISGAVFAPFLLALAVARLPPALDGPVHSWLTLLWYSLSSLFCEWAQKCLKLELFMGKFSLSLSLSLSLSSFFFPPLWLSHGLGFYLMLALSDCPQGIQAWSLP